MKTGRLPLRVSACLTLAGLLVGLLAVPSALANGGPTISSFSPTCGPTGTSVDVMGNNFQGTTQVTFNLVVAAFDVQSSHLIKATVPAGATTGKIGVVTGNGSATSTSDFTVSSSCAPVPTISSFSPSSGPVGTSVTINGTGLSGATAVKFGGIAATSFSVNPSGTQISTTVPSGAVTGKITVTTPAGTVTSATNFTVTTTAPTISSFSPKSGPVGTSVRINGSGFAGATAVRFNGVAAASFTVNAQGTRIDTRVPTGATTGKITVTTPGGTATSAANFTVTIPAPTITSFSPTSGRTGTAVTITGAAFTGATAVRFGGVRASFVVNSATQITATVPVGAVTGKISVTTPGGTGTSAAQFTVVPTFHSRSISISLRRHLVVRGTVSAGGFDACAEDALVRIRRFADGAWRTIATTHTNDDGLYRVRVPDRPGRYRALAPRQTLGDSDICGRALSRVAFN
ncbi:MAG: IPT/TIG domain-containing protein [Nocardioidaceae bacterium]